MLMYCDLWPKAKCSEIILYWNCQKSSKLNSRPVYCLRLYGIMIQSLVIMWQCVPLLKRNVCSTEINPPAKIFGTHTSVALRLQASSIFNKTKNRHFCWNSDATQRRYLRQHDGVLFYFLTLQFNIEYENTPIISYGKKYLFLIETNLKNSFLAW